MKAPGEQQHLASHLEETITQFVRERLNAARAQQIQLRRLLAKLERPTLREILSFADGNQALASRLLSIHRTTPRISWSN